MKISELKQPYRRMAEYLAERNTDEDYQDKNILLDAFDWDLTNDLFWDDIYNGNHPEITEEIKTHFPPDFDFSGEEEKKIVKRRKMKKNNYPTKLNIEDIKKIIENYKKGLTQVESAKIIGINNAYLSKILHCYLGNEKAKQKIGVAVSDLINKIKKEEEEVVNTNPLTMNGLSLNQIAVRMYGKNFMELEPWEQNTININFERNVINNESIIELPDNPIIQNRIYTQLAKCGQFDQLPDTCEFSEAVELDVWDDESKDKTKVYIFGKFKKQWVSKAHVEEKLHWQYAQLPTKKIDFSTFKTGDVVEVETTNNDLYYGWLSIINEESIHLTFGKQSNTSRLIHESEIKSITKLK